MDIHSDNPDHGFQFPGEFELCTMGLASAGLEASLPRQLADAGADVDAFSLAGLRRMDGQPVKDLCDLAAIHPDDFETHRCLWDLFS